MVDNIALIILYIKFHATKETSRTKKKTPAWPFYRSDFFIFYSNFNFRSTEINHTEKIDTTFPGSNRRENLFASNMKIIYVFSILFAIAKTINVASSLIDFAYFFAILFKIWLTGENCVLGRYFDHRNILAPINSLINKYIIWFFQIRHIALI